MATQYRIEATDSEEAKARFNALRATLKSESYPNGYGGWQDNKADLFIQDGFKFSRNNGDGLPLTTEFIIWFTADSSDTSK